MGEPKTAAIVFNFLFTFVLFAVKATSQLGEQFQHWLHVAQA